MLSFICQPTAFPSLAVGSFERSTQTSNLNLLMKLKNMFFFAHVQRDPGLILDGIKNVRFVLYVVDFSSQQCIVPRPYLWLAHNHPCLPFGLETCQKKPRPVAEHPLVKIAGAALPNFQRVWGQSVPFKRVQARPISTPWLHQIVNIERRAPFSLRYLAYLSTAQCPLSPSSTM